MESYFPTAIFGWTFVGVLFALTAVMAVFDLRTAVISKKLTIATLVLGFVAQIVRGGLLAAEGRPVWSLGASGVLVGGFDGLLYACCGAVAAFALMFVLWILGTCGGGDVKL